MAAQSRIDQGWTSSSWTDLTWVRPCAMLPELGRSGELGGRDLMERMKKIARTERIEMESGTRWGESSSCSCGRFAWARWSTLGRGHPRGRRPSAGKESSVVKAPLPAGRSRAKEGLLCGYGGGRPRSRGFSPPIGGSHRISVAFLRQRHPEPPPRVRLAGSPRLFTWHGRCGKIGGKANRPSGPSGIDP